MAWVSLSVSPMALKHPSIRIHLTPTIPADPAAFTRADYHQALQATVATGLLSGPDIEVRRIPFVNQNRVRSMDFGLRRGPKGAPLVMLIPGFGTPLNDSTSLYLSDVIQKKGFHVATVHSPSYSEFITDTSRDGVPGVLRRDSIDLHAGLLAIADNLKERGLTFDEIHLVGYSLGALNAAFLAQIDEHVHAFKRIIMINPVPDSRHGIGTLDRFVASSKVSTAERLRLMPKIARSILFRRMKRQSPEDKIRAFLDEDAFTSEELSVIVGHCFSQTVSQGAEAASRTVGFNDPRRVRLYSDYLKHITLPYYRRWDPAGTVQDFFRTEGFSGVEQTLKEDRRLHVLHNEDDFLLRNGDADSLRRTFGSRCVISPNGGHIGQFWRADFQNSLTQFLRA